MALFEMVLENALSLQCKGYWKTLSDCRCLGLGIARCSSWSSWSSSWNLQRNRLHVLRIPQLKRHCQQSISKLKQLCKDSEMQNGHTEWGDHCNTIWGTSTKTTMSRFIHFPVCLGHNTSFHIIISVRFQPRDLPRQIHTWPCTWLMRRMPSGNSHCCHNFWAQVTSECQKPRLDILIGCKQWVIWKSLLTRSCANFRGFFVLGMFSAKDLFHAPKSTLWNHSLTMIQHLPSKGTFIAYSTYRSQRLSSARTKKGPGQPSIQSRKNYRLYKED